MRLAGIVIIYNPTLDMFKNIISYIYKLEKLFVIDNSVRKNIEYIRKIKEFSNVYYVDNKGNKGVSHALNQGAKLAIKEGFKWFLTLDQDSYVMPNMIEYMCKYIEEHEKEKIGIIAPYLILKGENNKTKNSRYQEIVITSGNIVNVKAYKEINGYLDKLFIDYVDFDFCFRMRLNHYQIVLCEKAFLKHRLGNKKNHFEYKQYLNRDNIRLYYAVRNGLYIIKKYKNIYPSWYKNFRYELIKIIFYEVIFSKDKIGKMRSCFIAIKHFCSNKYGKILSKL